MLVIVGYRSNLIMTKSKQGSKFSLFSQNLLIQLVLSKIEESSSIYTMRNIIEIREIRESSYEISKYVHTFFQKVRKRVQHLEFHQKCVRTLAGTDFLNSCPIICKSLQKLCKSGKVFIVVQLRTFCTSIQELVMFLVNSNFFY